MISIRNYISEGIINRTVFCVKQEPEGSELIILIEINEGTIDESDVPVLNGLLMKKFHADIHEYFNCREEWKTMFEREKKLYKTMIQKEKEFTILYHENKRMRIKMNEDATEFIVQGDLTSNGSIRDIINIYSQPDRWDIMFPISVLTDRKGRTTRHHKETILTGVKTAFDLTTSYKSEEGFGIAKLETTNDGHCRYKHVHPVEFWGGLIILSTSSSNKKIRYAYHYIQKSISFLPKHELVKNLNLIGTSIMLIHTAFIKPHANLVVRNELMTQNETANQIFSNANIIAKMQEETFTTPSILTPPNILHYQNDIFLKIFHFLSPKDISILPFVCKRFHSALQSETSNYLYKDIYEKHFNIHTFDKRYENTEILIPMYRSEFLIYTKRERNRTRIQPSIISLHQSIDKIELNQNGIVVANGKKLMTVEWNGKIGKLNSYGNISCMKRGINENELYVHNKSGDIYRYGDTIQGEKLCRIECERGSCHFGFGGQTLFHIGNELHQYDCFTGNELWKIPNTDNTQCIYDFEQINIVGKANGIIEVYDRRMNEMCYSHPAHYDSVIDIRTFNDHYVSIGKDNAIRLWEMRMNGREYDRRIHIGSIRGFDLYNRKIVSYSSAKDVILTSISHNQLYSPITILKTEKKITNVISNERYIVTSVSSGDIFIHDLNK